jgi:hypothetical protein
MVALFSFLKYLKMGKTIKKSAEVVELQHY